MRSTSLSLTLNHRLSPTAATAIWFLACSSEPMSHPIISQIRPDSSWVSPKIAVIVVYAFCSAFSKCCTHLAQTFLIRNFSGNLFRTIFFDMLTAAVYSTNTILCNFLILSRAVAVFNLPSRGLSSRIYTNMGSRKLLSISDEFS